MDADLEEEILNSIEKQPKKSKMKPHDPEILDIFPLVRRPFFPGMAAPLVIEPGPFYEVLKKVSKTDHQSVGFLLAKKEEGDINKMTLKDLYKVGVQAKILRIIPLEKGGAQVIFTMEKRIKVAKAVSGQKTLRAKVAYQEDNPGSTSKLKAYSISIISTIKELLKLNPLFKEELQIFLSHSDFTEPGKIADFAVALTTASRSELQEVLETFYVIKRIEKALILLKKELDLSKLQQNINQKIETTITKGQKDFFLREQLKTIKKELGIEKDDKTIDREKFELRLKERKPPFDVLSVIKEEMEKLNALDPLSAEYAVARGYLDWLTIIPWGVYSEENHDLDLANKVLQEDHYGLQDIKQRILEFISVGKLAGSVKGSIICIVGPPGVGKTSVGKSIARALNRKFYRFSVGGMRDEAEIKGHRRTYVGAMPGKIIQALKYCKTMNPVIMLDEVDKIGTSYQGDPASALLEVLDPEQNSEFLDHFLDVRCDLSEILFILTANVLDTIPDPLLDRLDIMRLSGYIVEEKVAIAKKYLIPRNRKLVGMKAKEVTITQNGLLAIINGYARDAGVRGLENHIKKILRKLALQIVQEQAILQKKKRSKTPDKVPSPPVISHRITSKNLEKYLGKPVFTSERFYEKTPIGVCTGLAWTSLGGATLYIESIKTPGEKTKMKLTGQAGQVMKESSEIAWSYLHSTLNKYAPGFTFFENAEVHMHIPEGATPKDGPSAGITLLTSMLSLLMACPVLENLGMTGEITLTGKILPIGGVKEKLVAAKRSGLNVLIFPKENKRDWDELPDYLKKGVEVNFVEHYDEVYRIAFPKASVTWK
ncbi:MAG: endopeptidase La [Waddliaceae bacterium]